jgi:hypothetical protein
MAVAMFLWLAWLILAVQGEYLHAQDLPYKGKTIRVIVSFRVAAAQTQKAEFSRGILESTFSVTPLRLCRICREPEA